MQPHEQIHRNRKKMLIDNFLGGIAWSVGVFIGGTLIVAVITLFLSKVNLIPIIGDFLVKINSYVQSNSYLVK